ncbi:MAG: ATP-binding domain-containing protein, partial [Planctomycetota bacterium]|nr:ATP-binding domain-containing protein [Planctomycetota bacterium]
ADRQGIFYVFFDDNQQLSEALTALPVNMMSLQLEDNVRTTRAIHKDMVAYYQGQKEQRPRGPSGRSVERVSSDGKLQPCVRRVVADLLKSERFNADDIVVLVPDTITDSSLNETGLADARKLTSHPKLGTDVLLSSIRDFKGLERAVVIVAEYDRLPDNPAERRRLLYTAYSRPKFHLILIDEPETRPA